MKNTTTAAFIAKHSREDQFKIYIRFAEEIRNEEDPKVGRTLQMVLDNWDLINDSNKREFARIVRALKTSRYMTGIFCGYAANAIEGKFSHPVISRAG